MGFDRGEVGDWVGCGVWVSSAPVIVTDVKGKWARGRPGFVEATSYATPMAALAKEEANCVMAR